MSVISVFTVTPGAKAVLDGIGFVIFDGHGNVCFQFGFQERSVSLPTVGLLEHAIITLWSDSVSRTVLLHPHKGILAASVRLETGSVSLTSVGHDRSLEGGLWHDDFVETSQGPLLVYELGVIAFNRDGTVRWRAEHPTIQWVFLGVDGNRLVFDNEFEGQWRYRLDDGRKEVVSAK
jgi:hypothetical protein